MKGFIGVLLTIILVPALLVAQAMYVDQESTIGIYGSFDSESESDGTTTTITAGGIYTFSGIFDVIVELDRSNYQDDTDDYYDILGTGLGIGAFYHIKSESMPFYAKIGGYYSTASLESEMLDDYDLVVTGKSSAFGGGLYKNIVTTDSYKIIPNVDFYVVNSEITIEDTYYNESESDNDSYNSLVFGVGVLLNSGLWIEPSVSQVDGNTELNVSIGFILPQ